MKAPPGYSDLYIELKYEAGGVWHDPWTAGYQDTGAWERLEVTLDPATIPDLERVSAIVRHVGTTGAPAYIDDLQLITEGPVATTYDVEVATDSVFSNVIESRSGIEASTAEDRTLAVEGLNRTSTYHWRVRGTNAGGPGTWTTGAFTTTDRAPRRYYVKDHLGSIRAVVDPDAPGTGIEQLRWSPRRWWRPATTTPLASGCPGEA